jgi:homoserine O-acetyltransferase
VIKLINKKDSVGIVETKYFEINKEIVLECGKKIRNVTLAYETYGKLDEDKSNAILIFHALSGDSHVAGYNSEEDRKPGWWDTAVGPNKAFDTNKYFVICINVIGGCKGSTGPSSINPKTGKQYGIDFPMVTIKDMVKIQKEIIDHLGIKKLLAVTGGSMGGMQVLQWAVTFPDAVRLVIPIATAVKQSAQNIAFHEVGRRAITADPNWNNGGYYDGDVPKLGLSVARMIGHITYLSEESMKDKFGRRLQDKEKPDFSFETEFQVESYLQYQGDKFVERFDANSYLYITKAIDYFDLTDDGKIELEDVFSKLESKFLVISYTSDWLYTTAESKQIVRALQKNGIDVVFFEIESNYGHDAFLLENETQTNLIRNFLDNNYRELKND